MSPFWSYHSLILFTRQGANTCTAPVAAPTDKELEATKNLFLRIVFGSMPVLA